MSLSLWLSLSLFLLISLSSDSWLSSGAQKAVLGTFRVSPKAVKRVVPRLVLIPWCLTKDSPPHATLSVACLTYPHLQHTATQEEKNNEKEREENIKKSEKERKLCIYLLTWKSFSLFLKVNSTHARKVRWLSAMIKVLLWNDVNKSREEEAAQRAPTCPRFH